MKNKNLNTLVKISFLGAMAFLIMMIKIKLPIFPQFLEIDLSDVPALLGAFALGPIAGVVIELLKNILNGAITGSTTLWVGELANFLVGSALVFTAGFIYKRNKSRKTAIQGIVLGIIAMSLMAALFNNYVLIPFYATLFHMKISDIVAMGTAVSPKITDLKTLIVWSIIPFNLLKGVIVAVVTIPLYKKVSPIFHRESIYDKKSSLGNKEKLNQI